MLILLQANELRGGGGRRFGKAFFGGGNRGVSNEKDQQQISFKNMPGLKNEVRTMNERSLQAACGFGSQSVGDDAQSAAAAMNIQLKRGQCSC
jgi:hypothetical protein